MAFLVAKGSDSIAEVRLAALVSEERAGDGGLGGGADGVKGFPNTESKSTVDPWLAPGAAEAPVALDPKASHPVGALGFWLETGCCGGAKGSSLKLLLLA